MGARIQRLLEPSPIVAATIYPGSAHVTRRVELELAAGAHELTLGGVPPRLSLAEICVRVSRGVLRAVEREAAVRTPAPRPEGQELWALRGRAQALKAELALLDLLEPDRAPGGPEATARFLAGLNRWSARHAEISAELELVTEEERALLESGRGQEHSPAASALVLYLDLPQPGPVAIELEHPAGWATWRPHYQVSFEPGGELLSVERLADVWQETGEDWREVQLSCSTAEPERSLVPAELTPWRVEPARAGEVEDEPLAREPVRADHPDRAELLRWAEPPTGGAELPAAGRASLRSGPHRLRLHLGALSCPARMEYVLRPAMAEQAFGRLTALLKEPLLPGRAQIFAGDAHLLETELGPPVAGRLLFDVGPEPALRGARRAQSLVRSEGLLSREEVRAVDVSIEVENRLPRPVELLVQDQVPVSRDPKVRVSLKHTSPKDAELDELSGMVSFRLRLLPESKARLELLYEIVAPEAHHFVERRREGP